MATAPKPIDNPSPTKADEFKTMLEKNRQKGKKSVSISMDDMIGPTNTNKISRSTPPVPRARPNTKSTSKSSKSKPPIPRANPSKKKSSSMDRLKAASKKSSNTMMKRRDQAKKRNR